MIFRCRIFHSLTSEYSTTKSKTLSNRIYPDGHKIFVFLPTNCVFPICSQDPLRHCTTSKTVKASPCSLTAQPPAPIKWCNLHISHYPPASDSIGRHATLRHPPGFRVANAAANIARNTRVRVMSVMNVACRPSTSVASVISGANINTI